MTTIEEEILGMSEAQLDACPLGIIRLDRHADVRYYNPSQADFAKRDRTKTVGLNFFRDVAPCTAVRNFQGRFNEFVTAPGSHIEPFDFLFRFPWGTRDVKITMVRGADAIESFYIVVAVSPHSR